MEFNNRGNFKSNWFNKQPDDFPGTFPNFMTLTEEEKKEFYQTLLAAKENLEKQGVTVWPRFGTIHDKSWDSNALGIGTRKSIDNDFYISSGVTTCAPEVKIPTNFRFNISTDESYPAHLNLPSREPKKYFSNGELCTGFVSRENSEAVSVTSNSLENVNFGKQHECKALGEVSTNRTKNVGQNLIYKDRKNIMQRSVKHQDDVLKIKGKRMKVQVTLTSADNERIRKSSCKLGHLENPALVDDKKSSDELPTDSKKIVIESEDTESSKSQTSEEYIEDPELNDLLNVEKEESSDYNKDESEPKKATKEEKPRTKTKDKKTNERKRVESKITKTPKPENARDDIKIAEPPSVKDKKVKESLPFKMGLAEELSLGNLIVEEEKEKTFLGHIDSTILIRRKPSKGKNTKRDVDEGTDYELNDKLSVLQDETSEPEKPVGTVQRILSVTSLTGEDSNLSSVEKKTEETNRNLEKPQSTRPLQLKNREEHPLNKKRSVLTKKTKKQHKEGLHDSGKETLTEESSTSEEDPKESVIEQKGASGAYEKTINPEPCTTKIKEEKQESSEAGETLDPLWKSGKTSTDEKDNYVKRFESEYCENTPKGENPPLLQNGKVIFVAENVIEKIRNVIVDLERKAIAQGCDKESEYLILLVEHLEYLSTVIGNMIDNRTAKPTAENRYVKFDEENLSKIQEKTPSMTESDFDPNEESEKLEGFEKNKREKSWFLKFFRKACPCGKKK